MKKSFVIVVVVVPLIVGYFVYRTLSTKTEGYVMGKVSRESITEIVSESGSINSSGQAEVYSPSTGVVSQIYVKNGDAVKEGQKLFSVKSTASSQEKSAAFAALQAAQSALNQAENTRRATIATVDRVHDDVKDHDKDETFTQKELRTTAEVANDNAYDAILSARAQVTAAQLAYYATQNSTVYAPISGVISNSSVVPGSKVTAKIIPAAEPVLVLSGLGITEAVISIGESDINKIKVGQEATLTLDAVPNQIFHGVVGRFDDQGNIIQGVVKFNVYISLEDGNEKIKPGMTVDIDITTAENKDILAIPNSAVKPYQKGRAVRILKNNKVEYLPVKTGIKGKDYTQVLDGLSEGQEIIFSISNENLPKRSYFGL